MLRNYFYSDENCYLFFTFCTKLHKKKIIEKIGSFAICILLRQPFSLGPNSKAIPMANSIQHCAQKRRVSGGLRQSHRTGSQLRLTASYDPMGRTRLSSEGLLRGENGSAIQSIYNGLEAVTACTCAMPERQRCSVRNEENNSFVIFTDRLWFANSIFRLMGGSESP